MEDRKYDKTNWNPKKKRAPDYCKGLGGCYSMYVRTVASNLSPYH